MTNNNLNTTQNERQTNREKSIQKIVKYLGFSGIGVGLPATIKLLLEGKLREAIAIGLISIIITFMAIAHGFVARLTNKILDKIEEELENREEPIANWVVNQSKTLLIKGWWWVNPKFKRAYYNSLIDNWRELKVEGYRIGLPALDLENVYVHLRIKVETPERIEGVIIYSSKVFEGREIWDFLRQSKQKKFQSYRRLAIVGAPGSGKTTLLKYITLTYANQNHKKYKVPKYIPVLLYLRDIRHLILTENPPNLLQLIVQYIKALPVNPALNPPHDWIEDQIKVGNCLVMLDGLDEVASPEERGKVSEWVNQQMKVYRQTPFILTSRPYGYLSNPVGRVGTVLEVLPFNLQQAENFIHNLYRQNEIQRTGRDSPAVLSESKKLAEDLIGRIKENRAIADMAKNPLLITMIATVHYLGSALPGRRVELYQKICDLLLGDRQKAKKIETYLSAEQNKSILQVLALTLMQLRTREFKISQGIEIIQEKLQKVASHDLTPQQLLEQIKDVSGLLVEREIGLYEFAHLSFQEYLAAAEIKRLQQESVLLENINDTWWAETIRLYAAQSDATNLIEYVIAHPSVTTLTLALDCCQQEKSEVNNATKEKLYEILEAGLESQEQEIAKLAAEVKLLRRLNNLLKIDESLEIDQDYITVAEYKLFLREWVQSNDNEPVEPAKNPITRISQENALNFCAWLTEKAVSLRGEDSTTSHYYRLPMVSEAQAHPTSEHHLECWTMNGSESQPKGLRIVKTNISCLFSFQTIRVNSAGQIVEEKRLTRNYFRETLRGRGGKSIDIDMMVVPAGKFWMGSPESEKDRHKDESPQHLVTVPAFFMSQTQVTQAQWRAIASLPQERKELNPDPSRFKGDDLPVERVSWQDAIEFCARLSRHTGRNYRLPSEAEWEYACRAIQSPEQLSTGADQKPIYPPFHFGETITSDLANYNSSVTYQQEVAGEYRGKTTPVRSFPPNVFGLYDMHGNVWEWCLDPWHGDYKTAPTDGRVWDKENNDNRYQDILNNINVLIKDGRTHILRGGYWNLDPRHCRSAYRSSLDYDHGSSYVGFRPVFSVQDSSPLHS